MQRHFSHLNYDIVRMVREKNENNPLFVKFEKTIHLLTSEMYYHLEILNRGKN